ncbi:MAG: transposase [Bacteroidales bacterium]
MTQTKIWVHAVWGIRGRHTLFSNGSRQEFLDHLQAAAVKRNIELGVINCWIDHIHCLVRLRSEQSLETIVKELRSEASQWIKSKELTVKRFSWDKEYYAASVSEGNLPGAKNYILSQERLHANRTYKDEVAAYFSLDFPVKNH